MSELPQLDPQRLYQKANSQVAQLNAQCIEMDTMIEMLTEERDKAIEERDKAQQQLHELTAKLSVANNSGEEPALEGVVV